MFRRLAAGLLLLVSGVGQETPDATIRITVNLVQVDAVVTDSKGRPVPGLEAKDFELLQDGKPQKITHCTYISIPHATATPAGPQATLPTPTPTALQPSQFRRTVALVVDDLGLSFESMARVRSALKQFVDRQMQAGDLVAILRTGAGMGVLQQFTSDKRLLYAAVDHVRYNALRRESIQDLIAEPQLNSADSSLKDMRAAEADLNELRERSLSLGTLGAIRFVVNGLTEFPGRKSVVLFSDSMRLLTREKGPLAHLNVHGISQTVVDSLEQLADLCNRNAIVVYTVDPRGVTFQGFTAADQLDAVRGDTMAAADLSQRSQDFSNTQEGLNLLAHETGGLFVHNTNDISAGLNQILDDQSGYYLIGYVPDSSTFEEKSGRPLFHRISIRVTHNGMRVRTRSGFYGVPDQAGGGAPGARGAQLLAALNSPFSASGIHVRLTPLFANNAKEGSFIDTLLYVDAHDLTFAGEPDDWHKAVLEVAAVTFGDNRDEANRRFNVRLHGEDFKRALDSGLVFRMHHPIKKAGAYQLRCAVQDDGSGRLGSASQFIEVPDLTQGRLALSGVVVSGALQQRSALTTPVQDASISPLESPAVRVFKPGDQISWALFVMNARLDASSHQPNVRLQLRMFHDGQEIYTGQPLPAPAGEQTDLKRIFAGGRLRLGSRLEPGNYTLEVVATDNLATAKHRTATQSMDFEIQP
ncbi:MAG TPA: VWA domain-containing protein [Bryobacteraceae bacterium]|nr:VWA domain-containing protein [Bryobacteraceae bacterium]